MLATSMLMLLIAEVPPTADGLKNRLEQREPSFDAWLGCLDKAVKVEMHNHIRDASAALVVDGALLTCKSSEEQVEDRTVWVLEATTPAVMARERAKVIQVEQHASVRSMYLDNVEKWLVTPKLAENRLNLVQIDWSLCIKGKAKSFSHLKDEAMSIGIAAVKSCDADRVLWRKALGYYLASASVPSGKAVEIEEGLIGNLKEQAVAWVIEERASALPKR